MHKNGVQASQGEVTPLSIGCRVQVDRGFSTLSESHVPPKGLSGCFLKNPLPFYLGPKKTP